MKPSKFRLEIRRHPQAESNTFDQARPISEVGLGQLSVLVPKLLRNDSYDQILCTPTVRTLAVVGYLTSNDEDLAKKVTVVHYAYPDAKGNRQIWEMFKGVKDAHTPAAFSNHQYYPVFRAYCAKGAPELLEACFGNSTLLIGHGVISQEIAACLVETLSLKDEFAELATHLRQLNLSECEGIFLEWNGKNLTCTHLPFG
jgi:hypothetical protein